MNSALRDRPFIKRIRILSLLTWREGAHHCPGMPYDRGLYPGTVVRVYRELGVGNFEIVLGMRDPDGTPYNDTLNQEVVISPPAGTYEALA